jgi:hypothetical protein
MDPKKTADVPAAGPEPSTPKRTNLRAIIIVVIAIIILIAAVVYAVNRGRNEAELGQNGDESSQEGGSSGQNSTAIAPQTFVYGTWSGDNAIIKAFDMESGELSVLASLPDKIKKVTVLDKDHLLYIYNTNVQDHGSALAVYSLPDGVPSLAYSAAEGFGIDDYVVSPDKRYVAVWEVKFSPGSGRLSGGTSRVYTAAINEPGKKNLIYDEVQQGSTPVHYPRAITNSGQVYTDQFLPNILHGWGYGMSVSDFTGTTKENIADMQDGSYGTQPTISPDGRYLLFTAFTTPKTGLTPQNRAVDLTGANTIALYDLQTGSRRNLANLQATQSFIDAQWDSSGDIIYWALGPATANTNGMYKYDLSAQKSAKLPLADLDTEFAIATLQNGKVLVGVNDADLATVGNLGNAYSPPFNSMYVVDMNGGDTTDLGLQDNLIQYISLFPASYFSDNGQTSVQAKGKNGKDGKKNGKEGKNGSGDQAAPGDTGGGDFGSECTGYDNLQLCPFYFKAQLETKRETQQTIPACYEGLIGPECERRGYNKNSNDKAEVEKFRACLRELVRPYRQLGFCGGSPLYLYGNTGQHVNVKIGTGVHGAVPSYNDQAGYDIVLRQGGVMEVNGGTFERISYDYDAGIKRIVAPARGVVVAKADVEKQLRVYAGKLGLNEKETSDLLAYGREKVISPYVYISYFDQAASEKILPISFSPEPDNYLNVVFYFRLLSSKPSFNVSPLEDPEPVKRNGFTAVEVSAIVE